MQIATGSCVQTIHGAIHFILRLLQLTIGHFNLTRVAHVSYMGKTSHFYELFSNLHLSETHSAISIAIWHVPLLIILSHHVE